MILFINKIKKEGIKMLKTILKLVIKVLESKLQKVG